MASDEMIQAINKHLGNAQDFEKFIELTKRFENFNGCSRAGAAAIGYLIAKDELEATKEEEEEPDVYDEAIEVIRGCLGSFGGTSPRTAADEIFTLIYKWLDEGLKKKGHPPNGRGREDITELFLPFIIK